MDNILLNTLNQLLIQTPVLLVYLLGLILALLLWRRCPGSCLLTLIATVLLLMVTVTQTFVTQYLIVARAEMGLSHEKFGWILSAVALTGNILRALGLSFLVAAVFLGRTVRPSEEQGVTRRPGGC